RQQYGVGTQNDVDFAAQWLAYAIPYRRFVDALTETCARLGADVVCYSFIAVDSHHLLLAGRPAHTAPDPTRKFRFSTRHSAWVMRACHYLAVSFYIWIRKPTSSPSPLPCLKGLGAHDAPLLRGRHCRPMSIRSNDYKIRKRLTRICKT